MRNCRINCKIDCKINCLKKLNIDRQLPFGIEFIYNYEAANYKDSEQDFISEYKQKSREVQLFKTAHELISKLQKTASSLEINSQENLDFGEQITKILESIHITHDLTHVIDLDKYIYFLDIIQPDL